MLHLNDRVDITYKPAHLPTGRFISQRTGRTITRPHTPLNICQDIAAALDRCIVEDEPADEQLTIEHWTRCRTYRLDRLTPASRARLLRIVHDPDWPTRRATPDGWICATTLHH